MSLARSQRRRLVGESRRSSAIPPNQANIEPPLKLVARLFRSMPLSTATSETSSLVSPPCEGSARFAKAAAVSKPTHTPSLNAAIDRNPRTSRQRSEGLSDDEVMDPDFTTAWTIREA